MPVLDLSPLTELGKRLEQMLEEFPQTRREFHERAGGILKQQLDQSIDSVFPGRGERIKGWQKAYIGSGGGYAAVRPVGSREGYASGANGPGAITNYLNSGHRIRSLAKKTSRNPKRYRYYPRIHQTDVPGKYFYQNAAQSVEGALIREAEQLLEQIAGGMA